MMKRVLPVAFAFLFVVSTLAGAEVREGHLVNVDDNGVILNGHDPVAYFTEDEPVEGDPAHQTTYQGATYHFASAENQAAFEADPEKYAPAYGGYCAYGVSKGTLASIDPEAFQIVDGRLMLQYSQGILKRWNRDPEGRLEKAEKNWPEILEDNGAEN